MPVVVQRKSNLCAINLSSCASPFPCIHLADAFTKAEMREDTNNWDPCSRTQHDHMVVLEFFPQKLLVSSQTFKHYQHPSWWWSNQNWKQATRSWFHCFSEWAVLSIVTAEHIISASLNCVLKCFLSKILIITILCIRTLKIQSATQYAKFL